MNSFVPRVSQIKGVSHVRRLPRLGKIRLGLKVKNNGKEFPTETDYFVCPPEVQAVFGEKPKELKIMFPLNDPLAVFPQAYTYYGKSKGIKCKGNGETAYVHNSVCKGGCRNHDTDDIWHERNCPCKLLETKQCSMVAHLLFMIPDVSIGGVYQLDTGSYHSIVDVNSGIDYVRAVMMDATGHDKFSQIPLILSREPRKTGGGETGVQQTHYTLNLRIPPDTTIAELAEHNKKLGLTTAQNLALPEPEEHNPEYDKPDVVENDNEDETTETVKCPNLMDREIPTTECENCPNRCIDGVDCPAWQKGVA